MDGVSLKLSAPTLAPTLVEIEQAVGGFCRSSVGPAVERYLADSAAARFHLAPHEGPRIIAIVGGTGTGKSTLLNRLLGANLSAASFRRTFTAGAVAVARGAEQLPANWLGIEHETIPQTDLPARGRADRLAVVVTDHPILENIVLVDTPDLDGDQPAHHAQADRAFRWSQAAVFLVTPEKYQMTELPPYYKLAARYDLPALFVINKVDSRDVLDDFTAQLSQTHGIANPRVFCIPRDDSTFAPANEQNIDALVAHLHQIAATNSSTDQGLKTRLLDLAARGQDQILYPLQDARTESEKIRAALQSLTTPAAEIDVHPITSQLQKRLQQKSVLYLMGPQRVFDRVRQVPLMLAKLPRSAWDLFRHGQLRSPGKQEELPDDWRESGPNFNSALADQLTLLQSKIDDLIRAAPQSPKWIAADAQAYADARIDPAEAGKIADEELAELRAWLEQRWNTVPRDTRIVQSMLKLIPGGKKLVQMSEAAPYLLAVVVASHHAVFGGVDLMILGGYSLATWITEKLSNEVASRTRKANDRIAQRYTELAQRQIDRMIGWLNRQSPSAEELRKLAGMFESLRSTLD